MKTPCPACAKRREAMRLAAQKIIMPVKGMIPAISNKIRKVYGK